MGYICHHAIIVTGFNEHVDKAHVQANRLQMSVSEIAKSPINGYRSFCIFPDGSKEGWNDSETGDKQRKEFIDFIEHNDLYLTWAELKYGDDGGQNKITRCSE